MTITDFSAFLASKAGRTKLWFAACLSWYLYQDGLAAMATDGWVGAALLVGATIPYLGYAFGQPSEVERKEDQVVAP